MCDPLVFGDAQAQHELPVCFIVGLATSAAHAVQLLPTDALSRLAPTHIQLPSALERVEHLTSNLLLGPRLIGPILGPDVVRSAAHWKVKIVYYAMEETVIRFADFGCKVVCVWRFF